MADAQLATVTAELESLRSSSTHYRLTSEQALHEFATKLAETDEVLESERAKASSAQSEQEELKRRISQLEGELKKEQQKKTEEFARDKESGDKEREREREGRELLDALERARSEKEDVEAQLSSLRSLHSTLQTSHSTLEASLLDATTTSRSTLLRLETANSTITSLTSTKEFLTAELTLARAQSSASRRESMEQLANVQSQLDSVEVEARGAKSALNEIRGKYESLKKRHDEVTSELQRLKEEAGIREGQFVAEMGSMRRLVDAMEKREEVRKARLDEVERGVEEERRGREEQEQDLLEDLRKERERGDHLELRCEELREAVERGASSFRGTPDGGDDSFAFSPGAMTSMRTPKKGRSYAEIYAEYVRMQEELVKERAEVKRLGECLSQILNDIEERAPVLKEQREEYDRLSLEATSLATELAESISDRETSNRRASEANREIERLTSEASISTSQLVDLGRQVRTLLRALGSSTISGNPDDFDESEAAILARADTSGDTDAVVSAHLVTFKTINELQVQNQKLLRITREMGAQMERAEDDLKTRWRDEENVAVEEAHELILRLKDEVESQRTTLEAQGRERDMLKRMLSVRVEGGTHANSNGAVNGHEGQGEQDNERLGDIQASFETYRTEMAVDTLRLREDLAAAQRDAGVARTELAKSKAQAEYTSERLQMLNNDFVLQTKELSSKEQRFLQLQQQNAKQEMASHKMVEELGELRSSNNQLHHESNNLRSEREVWKVSYIRSSTVSSFLTQLPFLQSVENRLINENTSLSKERLHLAELLGNLQKMQNEIERSGSDSRKRLEDQSARLESNLAEMKERLAQETDAGRQLTLRKELEGKAYQDRIDKLSAEHQATREALLVAKTSKEHIDQRVSDLMRQLAAKEEKLSVYEGRGSASDNPERTREEQLEASVAELRTELRAAKGALERANANVQQFQAIAETEGESLRDLTKTYDEYKASTDQLIAEKDVEINGLRERLHSLTTDSTAASVQNSDLHRQIEDQRTTFEKERKALEDTMVDLRSAEQTAREAQLTIQDDLRRQAQLAREAHEKYDRELVAHADDVKRLTEIKTEIDTVRATVQEYQAAAEVARANLAASESSWTRQKGLLEQEITDLNARTSDLNAQNKVLHTHLESIGAQATRLQQERNNAGADTHSNSADVGTSNSDVESTLRELIRYLRSEKELAEFQLDFTKQGSARLEHQLELANRSLAEARQALTDERNKAGESNVSSAQHAELLERIHTAKLLRESNQTLRDENEANLRKIAQLDMRLQQALAELDPLKERVHSLVAEIESKNNNIRLLEEDNERWKVRNQTILSNYERIDPEELQALKDEGVALRTRIAQLEATRDQLQTALASETARAKLKDEQFKRLQVQARGHRDDNANLKVTVATLETELSASKDALAAAPVSSAQPDPQEQARLSSLAEEKKALEARLAENEAAQASVLAEKTALENRLAEEAAQRLAQAELLEKTNAELATAVAEKTRLAAREKPIFEDNKKLTIAARSHAAALAKLQKSFEEANDDAIAKAVEARIALLPPPPPSPEQASIEDTIASRVAQAEATFKADRDSAIAAAVASATSQLQTELASAKAELESKPTVAATDGLPVADPAELAKLKAEFETAKKSMQADFEQVKARLTEEAKVREVEITTRLTAEIAKATEAANKTSPDASSSTQPPVDVDALVQAKLTEVEAERSAKQRQAIKSAIEEAIKRQKAAHEAELTKAKAKFEEEAVFKNKLLKTQCDKLRAEIVTLKESATPTASTSAAPTTSAPLPALVAQPGIAARLGAQEGAPAAAPPRGRGRGAGPPGIPAGRGRGAARGGGAAPSLALKGAAAGGPSGAKPRGGFLGALLQTSPAAPKRPRDSEESGSAGAPDDAAKRLKGNEGASGP
ncbi:nucleoprotein TPR, partial [Phenoliferia sp. Uapishka_3]